MVVTVGKWTRFFRCERNLQMEPGQLDNIQRLEKYSLPKHGCIEIIVKLEVITETSWYSIPPRSNNGIAGCEDKLRVAVL